MAGKPGRAKPHLTQAQKDAIAVALIESVMDGQANKIANCAGCGKSFKPKELSTAQVSLLRARYDKLRPSLSTIEQHNIDPKDKATEGDLLARLHSLLAGSPAIAESLLQAIKQANPGAFARIGVSVAPANQEAPQTSDSEPEQVPAPEVKRVA